MGCDIHVHCERKNADNTWAPVKVPGLFPNRDYKLFGFLANVRNYSGTPPISKPRGVPTNASPKVQKDFAGWGMDAHSATWLSVDELQAFNYEALTEDRRYTRQISPRCSDGGCTCAPGEGTKITFREFLGEGFFNELQKLRDYQVDRIVFWFDN